MAVCEDQPLKRTHAREENIVVSSAFGSRSAGKFAPPFRGYRALRLLSRFFRRPTNLVTG
jgi:hypothetical protein